MGTANFDTPKKRIAYVLRHLLPMLKNDLRVLVESGCPEHGCGTGPQFSLVLACMVACETIGALSAPAGVKGFNATRRFITEIGVLVDDPRYDRYAGLVFHMFRNGVGHTFLPKQCVTLGATLVWTLPCIETLEGTPEGRAAVSEWRRTKHLTISHAWGERSLCIVSKVLYLDLLQAILAFEKRLKRGELNVVSDFVAAFDRWLDDNRGFPKASQLTPFESGVLNAVPKKAARV